MKITFVLIFIGTLLSISIVKPYLDETKAFHQKYCVETKEEKRTKAQQEWCKPSRSSDFIIWGIL